MQNVNATALRRPGYSTAVRWAHWLVPDGVGFVLASKALRTEIHDRVTGNDVFVALHDELQSRGGGSVYLPGSTEET